MDHHLRTSSTVSINAGLKEVWDALVNPDKIAEYLYGTQTITDWKVGSEIIFQGQYEGWDYKDKGIVKELTYGDSSSRFDFNTHNHYHVICENCGKIVDFHYPQLDEVEQLAQHVTEFNVSHHRMEIYGVCKECQDKAHE